MKFKKTLLAVGTAATIAAPVAAVVACSAAKQVKDGGVMAQYSRAHDLLLTLGIAPQYYGRRDLSTTHNLVTEGFLKPFAGTKTQLIKHGGDKEYYHNLSAGLQVSTDMGTGIETYLKDPLRQFTFKHNDNYGGESFVGQNFKMQGTSTNAEAHDIDTPDSLPLLNWPEEETKLATKIDGLMGGDKYATRAKKVISNWDKRYATLKKDANTWSTKTGNEKGLKILVVRGDKDSATSWTGIIPKSNFSEMYGLAGLHFASPTDKSTIQYGLTNGSGTARPFIIKSKDATRLGVGATNHQDIKAAFAGAADRIIYLEAPESNLSDDQHKDVQKDLAPMLSDSSKLDNVIMSSYDDFYLPFRGAAIGANVVMDNLEKMFFKTPNYDSESWKSDFNADNLEQIYIPNAK